MFSLSRIGQVLQGLPRGAFQDVVDKHKADRHVKRFGCWDQFVAMLYGQLSGAMSLRELETGFNQHHNHHYHLHTGPVRRATLADANQKRNPEVFADVARLLMQQAGRALRQHRREMLYLLDSTSIALRGRGSQWTKGSATRTPGLKLHVLFASGQQVPAHQSITAANVNDVDEGRKMPIERGATYVFDKGYCDYNWWSRIDAAGACFVTRLKSNAAVSLVRTNALPPETDILADVLVQFTHRSSRGGHKNTYTKPVRRIEVARQDDQPIVLVTNDLDSPAEEISRLYKDRWQIELFFKWIKQHLSVKSFLGESENAVRIQLLIALIAYLLVALLNKRSSAKSSLWMALAELRSGLFLRPQEELSRWRRKRAERAAFASMQAGLFG